MLLSTHSPGRQATCSSGYWSRSRPQSSWQQPPFPPSPRGKAQAPRRRGTRAATMSARSSMSSSRDHGFSRRDAAALVRACALSSRRSSRRCSGRCSSRPNGTNTRRSSCRRRASTAASRSGARTRPHSIARAEPSSASRRRSSSRSSASRRSTAATRAAIAIIDALTTLAFDYPRRAPFFAASCSEFLLLARSESLLAARPEGLVRRRDGHSAVHARQLPPLRVDFDRRRPHRPVA